MIKPKFPLSEVLRICEGGLDKWNDRIIGSIHPRLLAAEEEYVCGWRFWDEHTIWVFTLIVSVMRKVTIVDLKINVATKIPGLSSFENHAICHPSTPDSLVAQMEHNENWKRLRYFMGQYHSMADFTWDRVGVNPPK